MYETLQIFHVILFGVMWFFSKADKRAMLYLCGSAVFYLVADAFLWEHLKPWPLGIYIHIIRACFDFFIIMRLYKHLSYFASVQALIIWMAVGLNLLAAVEFPFLYDIHFIRDIYTDAANILNVCQLIVGVFYGLYLSNLGDFLHIVFRGMVPSGTINVRKSKK